MNTNETYIKMCEKAEEMQAQWKPVLGDWICSATQTLRNKKSGRNVRVVQYVEDKRGYPIIHSRESMGTMDAKYCVDIIWLPRQDQLQEVMGLSDRQLMKQFRNFLIWITGVPECYDRYNTGESFPDTMPYGVFLPSFEQLWLAFVMKEKYNKVWNGEEWVKE